MVLTGKSFQIQTCCKPLQVCLVKGQCDRIDGYKDNLDHLHYKTTNSFNNGLVSTWPHMLNSNCGKHSAYYSTLLFSCIYFFENKQLSCYDFPDQNTAFKRSDYCREMSHHSMHHIYRLLFLHVVELYIRALTKR